MSTTGAAWPVGVRFAPLLASYSRKRDDNRGSWQPELGPPKTRRRHTAVSETQTMTIALPLSELRTLRNFYVDDLKDGTLPVLFPEDYVTGVASDCKFETPIDAVPTDAFDGGNQIWNASFVLRVLP